MGELSKTGYLGLLPLVLLPYMGNACCHTSLYGQHVQLLTRYLDNSSIRVSNTVHSRHILYSKVGEYLKVIPSDTPPPGCIGDDSYTKFGRVDFPATR